MADFLSLYQTHRPASDVRPEILDAMVRPFVDSLASGHERRELEQLVGLMTGQLAAACTSGADVYALMQVFQQLSVPDWVYPALIDGIARAKELAVEERYEDGLTELPVFLVGPNLPLAVLASKVTPTVCRDVFSRVISLSVRSTAVAAIIQTTGVGDVSRQVEHEFDRLHDHQYLKNTKLLWVGKFGRERYDTVADAMREAYSLGALTFVDNRN